MYIYRLCVDGCRSGIPPMFMGLTSHFNVNWGMVQVLQQQYVLTQRSRGIVFDFLAGPLSNHLNTPVPAFDNKTIIHLLEHTAYCYYNWLACFAMEKPLLESSDTSDLEGILRLYSVIDDTVAIFLQTFSSNMGLPITGVHNTMGRLSATPVLLFTHVLTHEFHHKGQVMTMGRLLGYAPPDTDVSNFFTIL